MATLYTVGHSTRSSSELIRLLRAHGVERVVDVRRYPGSRRHPHFAREALAAALDESGIEYRWEPALGGRRRRREASPHTAWRVAGFAAYADYMDTAEFTAAASRLLEEAGERAVAIMCAEARPEQCHRRLISDWMSARGAEVEHVMSPTRTVHHRLPEFARIEGDRIVYDGGQASPGGI